VSVRFGIGYDAHRLVEGRRLVLGGVEIDHDRGLEGHSDADVVAHAIMDALLGAAGLGDIGVHFPDDDERWRDADSIDLVRRVTELLDDEGLAVVHVDATVVAEAPRVAPHRDAMRTELSFALGVEPGAVNIKATRGEGMGFVGRGEGIAALAVATLEAAV
jgi:2-C-methyl-D-erythritol 2,4-cyclodiphosphate synthase